MKKTLNAKSPPADAPMVGEGSPTRKIATEAVSRQYFSNNARSTEKMNNSLPAIGMNKNASTNHQSRLGASNDASPKAGNYKNEKLIDRGFAIKNFVILPKFVKPSRSRYVKLNGGS